MTDESADELLEQVRDRAAANSGGSGPVAPCWFGNMSNPALADGILVTPDFAAITDGVAAGTDIVVDDVDPALLVCARAGVYLISWYAQAAVNAATAGTDDDVALHGGVLLNDDSVGPAYYMGATVPVPDVAGLAATLTFPAIPLVLAEGDTFQPNVYLANNTSDGALQALTLVATRIGDAAA